MAASHSWPCERSAFRWPTLWSPRSKRWAESRESLGRHHRWLQTYTHTHGYITICIYILSFICIYIYYMYTCTHTHTGCVYWLGNCLIGLANEDKLCQFLQFDGNANLGRKLWSKIQWAVDWTVLACLGPSQTAFDPEYPLVKLVKET